MTTCGSSAPISLACASFYILTRSHQRELRPRLKERLRSCPSWLLKNLSKFQSWTSLLSVGNINARSFLIRPACLLHFFYSLPTNRPTLSPAPHPRPPAVDWGQETPKWPSLLTLVGLDGVSRQRWAPTRRRRRVRENCSAQGNGPLGPRQGSPRPLPGTPSAPTGCGPALVSRPALDTPALGKRRTPPGSPGPQKADARAAGALGGRSVQRSAGVPRSQCRRGHRSSVPAPAARPGEGERRRRGQGAGRERNEGGAGAGPLGLGGRGTASRAVGGAGKDGAWPQGLGPPGEREQEIWGAGRGAGLERGGAGGWGQRPPPPPRSEPEESLKLACSRLQWLPCGMGRAGPERAEI